MSQVLRHYSRAADTHSNTDIDSERSDLNYDLTPYHEGLSPYEYYRLRLDEIYVPNMGARQQEQVTAASWIVTLPEGNYSEEKKREFFAACRNFIADRYGEENLIAATVHRDEGKLDVSTGELIGHDHLHVMFVPTTAINHDRVNAQRWHDPEMDRCDDQLSAAQVITRSELQHFHKELQQYLNDNGLSDFRVINGATGGMNRSVAELKGRTAMENLAYVRALQESVRSLEAQLAEAREQTIALARENADIEKSLAETLRINEELQRKLHELQHTDDRSGRWQQSSERVRGRWD